MQEKNNQGVTYMSLRIQARLTFIVELSQYIISAMTSQLLTLRYIPLKEAKLLDDNIKSHDIDKIIASIVKYGFLQACKWDAKANSGKGGIVDGNGRIEALTIMERKEYALLPGQKDYFVPPGIGVNEEGEWCVPVLFGVDSESEAAARAYAIDANILSFLGGDFEIGELTKLFTDELGEELEFLEKAGERPVGIGDELEELLEVIAGEEKNNQDDDEDEENERLSNRDSSTKELNTDYDLKNKCPKCGFCFD